MARPASKPPGSRRVVLTFAPPIGLAVLAVAQILISLPRALRRFAARNLPLPALTAALADARAWLHDNPLAYLLLVAGILTPMVALPFLSLFARPGYRRGWRVALAVFEGVLLVLNLTLFLGTILPELKRPG